MNIKLTRKQKEEYKQKDGELFNKIRCFCGCLVDKEDLIYLNVKINGKLTKRKVCPEHRFFPGGEQVCRIFQCMDCKKLVTVGLMEGRRIRCLDCQKKANMEAMNNYNTVKRKNTYSKQEQVECFKHSMMMKSINHPDNPFHCVNFVKLCGLCIKPYFECKMYLKYEKKD